MDMSLFLEEKSEIVYASLWVFYERNVKAVSEWRSDSLDGAYFLSLLHASNSLSYGFLSLNTLATPIYSFICGMCS